jgi:hypothetical protein
VKTGDYQHLLDGGVVGASRELAIDENARGEAHLALEGLIVVKLIGESCGRHCCRVGGGVNEGPSLQERVVIKPMSAAFAVRRNNKAKMKAT